MDTKLNIFSSPTLSYFKENLFSSVTPKQKRILVIAFAAIGLLVSSYLLLRNSFKKELSIHKLYRISQKEKLGKELNKSSQLDKLNVEDLKDDKNHEVAKQKIQLDKQAEKTAGKSDPKIKAQIEQSDQKDTQEIENPVVEKEEVLVDPQANQAVMIGASKDETQKSQEDDEALIDQSEEKTLPTGNSDLKEDSLSKKSLEKVSNLASALQLQTDFSLLAIDHLLTTDQTLTDDNKKDLLNLKEKKTKENDLIQDVVKGITEMRELRISDMKEHINQDNLSLTREKSLYDKVTQKISQINDAINHLKQEIASLSQEVDNLSQGTHELLLHEVSYQPDDEITTDDGKNKVKASQYVGTLTHQFKIGETFNLISKDQVHRYDLEKQDVAVITGDRYQSIGEYHSGIHNIYGFTTIWKGDGVLPWIKIHWLSLNKDYHEATIINNKADIGAKKRAIVQLEDDLKYALKDQKRHEDEIKHLKDSIDNYTAELKKIS